MKKRILACALVAVALGANAQKVMTPEMLLQLGRVNAIGITKDGKSVVYGVKTYSVADDKSVRKQYIIPLTGGTPAEVKEAEKMVANNRGWFMMWRHPRLGWPAPRGCGGFRVRCGTYT